MASWLFALGNILYLGIQEPLASVSGRISDAETGAPIAGVVVSVAALGRATLSDSLGGYLIDGLPAGTYELAARRIGYAPWSVQVLLAEGATVDVAFALRPEPVRIPEIEALAPGPQVSSASQPTPGQNVVGRIRGVTSAQLSTHPLLPEPDYFVAVSGGEVYVAPESPEGMHLLGGSTDQVDYVLDGIPVLNPYHAGGTFSAWNPDALSHADLTMSPLAGGAAQVLGGTLVGHIPAPGASLETRGAITASHTRIRLSAPLGTQGGGALIGLRTGFAGLLGHQSDATYLGGGNHDWLARLELPAVGGRFFILGYGSADHLSALTASALARSPSATEARHHFAWSSKSYGAGWSGPLRGWLLQLRGWVAGTQADAGWFGSAAPEVLTSSRRDLGVTATIEQIGAVGSTAIGIRAVQSGSDYWARRPEAAEGTMRLMTDQVLLSASVEHRRSLSTRVGVQGSLVGTWTRDGSAVGPSAGLWWQPAGPVTLSVSYTRRHQFIQSLRSPESVAGAVFPADLSVGSGSATFPAARSDLGLVSIDYRPAGAIRIGARAYARTTAGQALVAVREAGPFATGPVAVGSASTRGAVLEIGAEWRRIRLLGSYGYRDGWVEADGMRYRPSAAVPHTVDAGITLAPATSWSVRLGVSGQFGRRATAVRGPFEWESCNLRDHGCEFAGSPELVGPIGGVALPGYLRVDLGLRREWSVTLFGRAGTLAAFGTATNLLGRRNLLTTMVDPGTGARDPVEMRPRSPLAIGFDWRF